MKQVNVVIEEGNLTRDPIQKEFPNGNKVVNLSIAQSRYFKKKSDDKDWQTETSYFDVEYWTKTTDKTTEALKKGIPVLVQGRLKQNRWEKEGKTESRVLIVADSVDILPAKKTDEAPSASGGPDYDLHDMGLD